MISTRRFITVAAFALTSTGLTHTAYAQYVPEEQDVISVSEQRIPEYEPDGMRFGQFEFLPAIEIEEKYDDNIYRTSNNEESDFITRVKPSALMQSDWKNHQLQFVALGDFGFYQDNDTEDYEDYTLQLKGRYDILYDTYFHGTLRHNHLHEDRSSPNEANGAEPTELDVNTAKIGFTRELARLKLFTHAQFQQLEFDDAFANGVAINNDDRNRDQQEYQIMLSYEFQPNYDIFTRYTYNIREYDSTGATNRDSTGNQIEVGTSVDISGKAKGEIYAGYLNQDYDQFDNVDEITYGGELLWNVTGLTSIKGLVEREVRETTVANASSFLRTRYRVGAEHAFMENLLVVSHLQYIEDEFETTGGTGRDDEYYGAGAGMKYTFRPGLAANLGYDYIERDSTVAAENYDNNVVSVSLSYAY
ncbi:MAG: outer membrane beta-barrel protein [Alphaproteobacteria bacterium]|nr:outer membrane beta-barrel protein [Alphaproteobacteria bacterium]